MVECVSAVHDRLAIGVGGKSVTGRCFVMLRQIKVSPFCRFFSKVEFLENGCWQWVGAMDTDGYGMFSIRRHIVKAHRFIFALLRSELTNDIDHLCRNRGCVNPWHMEDVTRRTNILRGVSHIADQVKRTHCPKGHPYDVFNTRLSRKGKRSCKECHRMQDRLRKRQRVRA